MASRRSASRPRFSPPKEVLENTVFSRLPFFVCRPGFGVQTLHPTQTYSHVLEYCPIYIINFCAVCCSLSYFLYAIQPPALISAISSSLHSARQTPPQSMKIREISYSRSLLYPGKARESISGRPQRGFFCSALSSSEVFFYGTRLSGRGLFSLFCGFPRRRKVNCCCGGIGDFLHARIVPCSTS